MSFGTALWTGVSGLIAAQRQLEVAAHNIANVNTEGYSRQRVELTPSRPSPGNFGARGDGQVGTGVSIADIVRMRNSLTDAAYRGEAGNNAAAQARSDVLTRAETVLGPLDSGVPGALSEFWAAWDNLSLNGNDTAGRQAVLDAGAALTNQLRSGASQLARLTTDTGLQINDTVDEINRLAKEAAELNQAVMNAVGGQQSPNDLKDQRDQVVDKLAALTGGIVREGKLGSADVYVSNRALVRGGTFETMKPNVGSPAGATWAMDNVAINTGGRLGAYAELVNTTLPGLAAELDAFAVGMRDLINGQHALGFDQDGNPGGAFFSGTSAINIGVDPAMTGRKVAASVSGAAVDGANALNIASLRTALAVGSSTLQEAIQGFAGHIGGLAASAKSTAASALTVLNTVAGERAEHSSVSTNEELADIVRFQHAYEASAKVIQVVDQCLDQLINVVGR